MCSFGCSGIHSVKALERERGQERISENERVCNSERKRETLAVEDWVIAVVENSIEGGLLLENAKEGGL